MAPRDGFEPPTNGLTVRRSTTELPGNSEEARIVGKPNSEVKESRVSDDGVGHVRCLQSRDFGRFELEGQGGDGIIEVLRLRRADDGCRDERLLRNPGQCDLCLRYAAGGGDGGDLLDDLAVPFDR
jgi:hypothetical protein